MADWLFFDIPRSKTNVSGVQPVPIVMSSKAYIFAWKMTVNLFPCTCINASLISHDHMYVSTVAFA